MSLYEKKYNEALEWMRSLYDGLHGSTKEDAEHYFPELKESEDEKTRKQILSFLKEFERDHYRNLDFSSWIAWLEKQGSQILANSAKTCKVESKFKVGDWVVDNQGKVGQISSVTDDGYGFCLYDGTYVSGCWKDNYHLWTIQDAKDGDVLVVNNEVFIYAHRKQMYCIAVAHCFVDIAGDFYIDGEFGYVEYGKTTISPATKEMCDLLFQKMKEEGYEWDAEKKKLKRVYWNKYVKCDPNPPSIYEESGYELDAEKSNEESNEGNCEIDGLYCAKTILEKTLGKVEGYQTDDGILEHKSAINAVTKLCDKISRGTRIN